MNKISLLTHYTPFDTWFDNIFDRRYLFPYFRCFEDNIDIKNKKDSIQINCKLAGYKKEDVSVELENDIITISANKTSDDSKSTFNQSISIGDDIDINSIKTNYVDGLLTIDIGKKKSCLNKKKLL